MAAVVHQNPLLPHERGLGAHTLTFYMATERYFGARVTANTFGLLGIEPPLGRDFAPDDDRLGAPAVVMLGHGIWANRYGADPEVLGRVIRVLSRRPTPKPARVCGRGSIPSTSTTTGCSDRP